MEDGGIFAWYAKLLQEGKVQQLLLPTTVTYAETPQEPLLVNMVDVALTARNVEALLFVNMGDYALAARNVEALLFVNMGDDALNARNVEALLFVNMGDVTLNAS